MMRRLSSREGAVLSLAALEDDDDVVKTRTTVMAVGRGRINNRRDAASTNYYTTGLLVLALIFATTTTPIVGRAAAAHSAIENDDGDGRMRRNGLRDDVSQRYHTQHHAERATETLAHWHRSLSSSSSSSSSSAGWYDMKGLRPLDLVLDDPALDDDSSSSSSSSMNNEGSNSRRTPLPKVYQRGDGGFLEPYDINNYQSNEERIDVSNGLAQDDEDDEEEEEEEEADRPTERHADYDNFLLTSHVMKERIGITNLDIRRGGVVQQHTPPLMTNGDEEEVDERRRLLYENQDENNEFRELVSSSSSSVTSTAQLVLHWCGTSHEDAASKCGKHCRKGHGCPAGEFCFGVGSVCDWKLEEIEQKRLDKLKDKNDEKDDKEEKEEEEQKKSKKKDDDRDKEKVQDKMKMKQRTDTLKDKDKEKDKDKKKKKQQEQQSDKESGDDENKSTKKKRVKSKNDDDKSSQKDEKETKRIKSKNSNNESSSQQDGMMNVMGYVSANVNKEKDDDDNKKRGYEIINGNIHVDIQPVNRRLRRRDVKNNNKDDEQDIVRLLKRREEETFDFTHHDKTKKSYYESSSAAVVDTDTSPPIVRSTFPPSDTTIGPRQTFGALVSDHASSYTSGVEKVCVQFRDAFGVRSKCLPLYNVGSGVSSSTSESGTTSDVKCTKAEHRLSVDCLSSSSSSTSRTTGSKSDIWERTFDGFGAFAGTAWKYRIQAYDTRKNRIVTKWQSFNIDARAEVTTTTTTTTTSTVAAATATSTVGSSTTNCGEGNVGNGKCPMAGDCCSKWGYCGVTFDHCGRSSTPAAKLVDVVKDENWPHGGVVQTSTGRILFFFDGNPYVCSGTVIKDPVADRTIVLTAGHCAYQYQPSGGRFTEHALFIPNQVDTRGVVSDELCTNDPLGCWVPAFAVVHYEWTTKGFPHSVPWDYAYYVIPNDVSAHLGGFIHENQKDLSRILEEIVEPMPIDFNWRLSSSRTSHLTTKGEFAHGLGYSFNRDPAFRYCASNTITKFGVPTYENLWLESCAMTGGSSGGPWLKDTDTDGRGTVISINSWGYATVPGMAGPNFSTASGSKAECLLEVAKNTPFEDVVGKRGIVVDNC